MLSAGGESTTSLLGNAVLTTLLEHTSDIALDPDQPPEWLDSLLVRRHERLPVRLTR